jgi:hypothetical protein
MGWFASDAARIGGKRQKYTFRPITFPSKTEPFPVRARMPVARIVSQNDESTFVAPAWRRVPSHIHHLSCSGARESAESEIGGETNYKKTLLPRESTTTKMQTLRDSEKSIICIKCSLEAAQIN